MREFIGISEILTRTEIRALVKAEWEWLASAAERTLLLILSASWSWRTVWVRFVKLGHQWSIN